MWFEWFIVLECVFVLVLCLFVEVFEFCYWFDEFMDVFEVMSCCVEEDFVRFCGLYV